MQDGQHGQGNKRQATAPLTVTVTEIRDGGRILLSFLVNVSSLLPQKCPHCGEALGETQYVGSHTVETAHDQSRDSDLEPLSNGQDVPGDAVRQEK